MDKIRVRFVEYYPPQQMIIITRYDRRENGNGRPQRHEFSGPITLSSRDRLRRYVAHYNGSGWLNEHEAVTDIPN